MLMLFTSFNGQLLASVYMAVTKRKGHFTLPFDGYGDQTDTAVKMLCTKVTRINIVWCTDFFSHCSERNTFEQPEGLAQPRFWAQLEH